MEIQRPPHMITKKFCIAIKRALDNNYGFRVFRVQDVCVECIPEKVCEIEGYGEGFKGKEKYFLVARAMQRIAD